MQNSVLNSPYSCFLLCLDRRKNLTVMVGAHDHIGSSRMEVKFYHIHPGYESKSLRNDIILLQGNDRDSFFQGKLQ